MKYQGIESSKNRYLIFFVLFVSLSVLSTGFTAENETHPLLRYPDIHDNLIVFVYGEDIWSVPAIGGVATRLTINQGSEIYPKISPDGSMIAFTGEYDGNPDVYVMNLYGGDITRVTYHPDADNVVGWDAAKNKILFRSRRSSFNRFDKLFLISPDGSGLEELILHEAALGSFSPDGKKIAYNRLSRERATWKRYQGGQAQNIYLFDFQKMVDKEIIHSRFTDRFPMWIGNKIYFSSDRDGVLNIYEYDLKDSTISQVTHFTDYDVRRPSFSGTKIIFELGGDLWLLDTGSGQSHRIPIQIKTDTPATRPYLKDVRDFITDFDCSPDGERAAVDARGEIFTVPRAHGATQNLTNSSGARDKDPAWSPDRQTIAYLSDKTGEYDIYLVDQSGQSEAVRLTDYKDGYRHTLRWSPDSRKIAFADQTLTLYYLDVSSKKVVKVDKSDYQVPDVSIDLKQIYDFTWSPDSRFLAYSKMNANQVFQLHIYELETGKIHVVNDDLFNDFQPVFTRDGQYLLFISNRRFDPTYGDFEWQMVYKKVAGIYSLILQKDGEPLFPFRDNEVKTETPQIAPASKAATTKVNIDFDGLAQRIQAFPLDRGNYRNLAVNDSGVFYLNADEGDFNRFEFRETGPKDLYFFSFHQREERPVIEQIDGFKLSGNGSNIIYKRGKSIGFVDAYQREATPDTLDLSGLEMWLDPVAEWEQIYNEAWRMERDFYYDPNMHGINWDAMKTKYGKLVPFASCRQDITYLIGELIGELSTSHTYVWGGDEKQKPVEVNVGMLGADYEVDQASNRYMFKKIYRVPEWTDDLYPPLTMPGVNVNEGDYLLEVNGTPVTADKNMYSYFQNLADKQVTITVNSKPSLNGARKVVVKPLDSESDLHYLDWVEHNREVAEKESNGEIGYLHFPDTYNRSARIFPKLYYSQTQKKGLIVDERFNAGGLDPDIFLSRLDMKPLSYWTRRNSHDQVSPYMSNNAHLVCIINKYAGSGGDEFPYQFRKKGMGPIIGTRTWGGLVGISMFVSLIDGGTVTVPDYRIYGMDGKWVVENVGVEPDTEVDLNPVEVSWGYDAQLQKAIEILKEQIKKEPRSWPKHPPFPVEK
jgi:tricorn protease